MGRLEWTKADGWRLQRTAARLGCGLLLCTAACAVSAEEPPPDELRVENAILRDNAERGDLQAQMELGHRLFDGFGFERKPGEALEWWARAAQAGHGPALCRIADCLHRGDGGRPRNDAQAAALWRRAALLNDPEGLLKYGWAYANGCGVARDPAEAVRWIRQAAALGHPEGQFMLGWHLENGEGVERNVGEAVKNYRAAAEQHHAGAQNSLGVCLAAGNGTPQDLVEAAAWLGLAAEAGESRAAENLKKVRSEMNFLQRRRADGRLKELQDRKAAVPAA